MSLDNSFTRLQSARTIDHTCLILDKETNAWWVRQTGSCSPDSIFLLTRTAGPATKSQPRILPITPSVPQQHLFKTCQCNGDHNWLTMFSRRHAMTQDKLLCSPLQTRNRASALGLPLLSSIFRSLLECPMTALIRSIHQALTVSNVSSNICCGLTA